AEAVDDRENLAPGEGSGHGKGARQLQLAQRRERLRAPRDDPRPREARREIGGQVGGRRNEGARSDSGEQDEELHLAPLDALHELEQRGTARERCLPERWRTQDGRALPLEHGRELVYVSSLEDDDTYATEWARGERHGATLGRNTAACQARTLTADERTSRRRSFAVSSSAVPPPRPTRRQRGRWRSSRPASRRWRARIPSTGQSGCRLSDGRAGACASSWASRRRSWPAWPV